MVTQRRTKRSAGKSTRAIAKRALRIAKSDIPELKAHDVLDLASGVVAQAWTINRVSTPAQGDSAALRDGDVVQNMSIQLLGNAIRHASSTTTMFRLVIVQDRQGNALAPVATQIFREDNVNSMYSFTAGDRSRFKVLFDHTYRLMTANNTLEIIKVFKRLSGRQTYNLGTDADGSIGKNSIFVCFSTNEATNVPVFDIDSRFVWRDV